LAYFIAELGDGPVTAKSLDSAKDWLDATAYNPYFINPVNNVMHESYGVVLTLNATYNWRVKLTASAKDKSRLAASFDGKHKVSRLKATKPLYVPIVENRSPGHAFPPHAPRRRPPSPAWSSASATTRSGLLHAVLDKFPVDTLQG
jgi:hypothetical protein